MRERKKAREYEKEKEKENEKENEEVFVAMGVFIMPSNSI